MENEPDLKLLETIQSLHKGLEILKLQVGDMHERLASVESDVLIRLAALLEKQQYLNFRVDPYSDDGRSIADSDSY